MVHSCRIPFRSGVHVYIAAWHFFGFRAPLVAWIICDHHFNCVWARSIRALISSDGSLADIATLLMKALILFVIVRVRVGLGITLGWMWASGRCQLAYLIVLCSTVQHQQHLVLLCAWGGVQRCYSWERLQIYARHSTSLAGEFVHEVGGSLW